MRDTWRLPGVVTAEELLPLADDDTAARALEVVRSYCRGEVDDEGLAEAHRQVVARYEGLRGADWARAPLYAAEWLTEPKPSWRTEMTPWKLVERARRVGPGTGKGPKVVPKV